MQRDQIPFEPEEEGIDEPAPETPTDEEPSLPEDEPEVDTDDEAELTLLEETGQVSTFSVKGVNQLSLTINFEERCWIRLFKNDDLVEEKTYHPGEELNMEAEESFEILLGFPRGAEIKVNELPVPGLDNRSSPYTIRLLKE